MAPDDAPAYLDLLTARTEDEFETAFTAILNRAVHHMEKNKKKILLVCS